MADPFGLPPTLRIATSFTDDWERATDANLLRSPIPESLGDCRGAEALVPRYTGWRRCGAAGTLLVERIDADHWGVPDDIVSRYGSRP
jgi:hypothetical protein